MNSGAPRPEPGGIALVAHDAGGAEVIAAWANRHHRNGNLFYLSGPAVRVFRRCFPDAPFASVENFLSHPPRVDLVVTGTGWMTDLERRAIASARNAALRVVAYLDHWTDYAGRFRFDGGEILPDEIWVGDAHAEQLARAAFPDIHLRLVPNAYLDDMAQAIRRASLPPSARQSRILFLCDPLPPMDSPASYGYDEFEALRGYLDELCARQYPPCIVRLRLHPAEPVGKYDAVVAMYRPRLAIEVGSRQNSLIEDCAWADQVVGCDTMAMVVAVLAGRRVISCIPPHGKPLTLPFPDIERLFSKGI